jgi:hypothetical protein
LPALLKTLATRESYVELEVCKKSIEAAMTMICHYKENRDLVD